VASFFSGLVIEIGRKIRAPEDEEPGVDTYTRLWGRRTATLVWWGAMCLAAVSSLLVARRIGMAATLIGPFGLVLAAAGIAAWRFLNRPTQERARLFEPISGLWTLFVYLGLGAGSWLLSP
jgi:4-hydroxybenzoate polyprenyltransferase